MLHPNLFFQPLFGSLEARMIENPQTDQQQIYNELLVQ